MLFILPGIVLIGIVALLVWGLFFRATLNHERTVHQARQRSADFERLLGTAGEPLYCVCCQKVFPGPLPPKGCPHCEVRAFVIPVRTSDDPTVAARAKQLCVPPVKEGEFASEVPATTIGDMPSHPSEILQQGKNKP